MKDFVQLQFNPQVCQDELTEFKTLLDTQQDLQEQQDILPFFKTHYHLSAFIGSYIPDILDFDLLSFEYSLFGDFTSDLVIGDSSTACYCFVEFENASSTSIFERSGKKSTLDWSNRFEHGFSQIVDWFYKLDDMEGSKEFMSRFGADYIKYYGMLILGRKQYLHYKEQMRLKWRIDKVLIDSQKVICLTFDDLYEDLNKRLNIYKMAYLAERDDKSGR